MDNDIALVTIAVATYGREAVLINTIESVLSRTYAGVPILIVDQTEEHAPQTAEALRDLTSGNAIEVIRLDAPSITHAMNTALAHARSRFVLFLDDDIIAQPGLVEAHLGAHSRTGAALVAGRVLQPWHAGKSDTELEGFASISPSYPREFIGANFSINRELAINVGGFDENFVGAAYQFEAEFARRLLQAGYKIYYEPKATILHLKAPFGGTRKFRSHLTTFSPDHAVGAYYYILRTNKGVSRFKAVLQRLISSVATRHHASRPWWIPVTLLAEIRGLLLAFSLDASGPKYIKMLKVESSYV